MRTVSDVLQNEGGHVEYVARDGKTIAVRYLSLKAMSEYENRLQNRAIRKLAEQRGAIPNDTFDKLFGDLMDRIASGAYAFGSELCSRSLATVQGVADLTSILCGLEPEDALRLIVAEGEPFRRLFDEVVRKSIGSAEEGDGEGGEGKK